MIGDRDIWGVVHIMVRKHGMRAGDVVAQCLAELEGAGDDTALATWRRIGAALERWRAAAPAVDEAVH